uniref:site-specific DNA-methyltransferase n=1 Tax=Thermomonas sp. TaxID=1971895 RepID=UPI0037832C4E
MPKSLPDQLPDSVLSEVPGASPDFRTELAARLAELVPEAVADGKIDAKKLAELLGDDAADEGERFGLFWPGKKRALRAAQAPTSATLKPDFANSKDWDTTQNVFIEGDNLEVLKILQRHYHNKVKLIYIDPPYNTGKDFVYPDNFTEGLDTYLEWTRQVNEEGRKVSTNSETVGRFHSNWLNMMYPRLKLARNLLTDDGVIFISIDDVEHAHLSKVCDEIFGNNNFVASVAWRSRTSISDDHEVSRNHNHILIYARSKPSLRFYGDALNEAEYSNPDNDPRGPWKPVPLDANKPGGDTLYSVKNPNTKFEHYPPQGRSWS